MLVLLQLALLVPLDIHLKVAYASVLTLYLTMGCLAIASQSLQMVNALIVEMHFLILEKSVMMLISKTMMVALAHVSVS